MRKTEVEDKVRRLQEKAEKKKAVKHCFKGRKGKLAMECLEDHCFWVKSTYVKGDPQGTALNEGIRNALLFIKDLIDIPDGEIDRTTEEKIKTLRQYERRDNSRTITGIPDIGSTSFYD